MEPITTIGAAVVAYRSAKTIIANVKDVIETTEDIGEIAGHLNKIFHLKDAAEHQHEKETEKKEPTKLQRILRQRTGDDSESETTLANVAATELAKREHDSMITQLSISIDSKFGAGTFKQIELAHARAKAKKIKARREAEKERLKQLEKKRERQKKILIEVGKFIGVGVVFLLMTLMLMNAYESGPIR
tara:strand:+ start:506 stop:1072 length:567 start_codon:yes stop_codon:yes gene_type:complete